tara:strand:+ start:97 stop:402 length:306 start_codon:yes stop_codon:yes gene_type:complete
MSIEGLIRNNIYKQYKGWIFLKDWVIAFIVMATFIFGITVVIFLFSSFVDWTWDDWNYFKTNGWWHLRLSIITSSLISFFLAIYLFPDSYDDTINTLKEGK